MSHESSHRNSPLEPSDLEELTAYLDGELEGSEMQLVEKRLATDSIYRSELQRLQKTWDVLDQLPRSESSATFTKSTIEMVVQDAVREVRKKKERGSAWLWRAAAILILPLIAFLSAQQAVSYWLQAPQRKLAQDLSVIENVDVYLKAESLEFLTALEESQLFEEENIYYEVEGTADE